MKELPFSKQKQVGRGAIDVTEYRNMVCKEADLQRQAEEYLQVQGIPFIRVPDAIYKAIFSSRTIKPYIKALISRFIKGLPDLIILDPAGRWNRACCIELKSATGKLSQGQKNFAKRVNVVVKRNFEDFVKEVEEFLNGKE